MAADPQWLRSSLCEDYAEIYRQRGALPDVEAIEAVVDNDIREWAAREREHPPPPPTDERPRVERDAEACLDAGQARAEQREGKCRKTSGLRVAHGGAVPDEIQTPPCPCGGECKPCKMRARLLAIMEPLPIRERQHVGPELWMNCRHPALAKECIQVFYDMKRIPGVGRKRQRYMSDEDLEKWTTRQLENICDRSNAIPGFGAWWVK